MATGYSRITVTSVTAVGTIQSTHQYNVTVMFEIAISPYGRNETGGAKYSITIDGSNSGSKSCTFNSRGGYVTIGSYTKPVTMDKSGQSKTINISAALSTGIAPSSISGSMTYELPAVTWQWTVSYNANGGSGAPASQTKTYGATLTLSNTEPTRTNYNFKGWSKDKSATAPTYSAGGVYTTDAAVTLYAVWELAYWSPKITNISLARCNSDGTLNSYGAYVKVVFNWECCQIIGSNPIGSITVGYATIGGTTFTNTAVTASGNKGNSSVLIGGGKLSVDNQYNIQITVVDSKKGTSTSTYPLSAAAFTIDFKSGGKGVAIGKPADTDNLFDVNWATRVRNKLSVDNAGYFGGGVTEQIPTLKNTDLNTMTTTGKWYVYDGTNRPVAVNGWVEVIRLDNDNIMQRYTTWSNLIYVRTKSNTWDDWTQVITQKQISSRFAGLTIGTPSNLGGTFNSPSGSSPYFRCIQLDGQSAQTSDRYFLMIDANGKLYTGRALNGATQITWVEK